MPIQKHTFVISFICSLVILFSTPAISADPPGRVARLSYINGSVSFSPASSDEWVYATLNRPLVTQDRLWTDEDGRVELQLSTVMAFLGPQTSMMILNLDDQVAQFKLTAGSMILYVQKVNQDQVYEIDTPNLALSLHKPGIYRVDVDPEKNTTTLSLSEGQGDVYGVDASYSLKAKTTCEFSGTNLENYACFPLAESDSLDSWAENRAMRFMNAVASRHVAQEIIGEEDLDNYGNWQTIEGYGYAWTPNQIPEEWAPYRYGHWSWINPWGWTWVDQEPWGFAPFHYGRWVEYQGRWYWVPGPREVEPIYSPAVVGFIALSTAGFNGMAWFPLGPSDVYIPPYPVSVNYFVNINVSNTYINKSYVRNMYDHPRHKHGYKYKDDPNAITTVPTNAFTNSLPVGQAAIPLSKNILDSIKNIPVSPAAGIAPIFKSLTGGAKLTNKPPIQVLDKSVIAKTPPPKLVPNFLAQQPLLIKNPGQPVGTQAFEKLKANVQIPTQEVKVVNPTLRELRPLPKIRSSDQQLPSRIRSQVPQPPIETLRPVEIQAPSQTRQFEGRTKFPQAQPRIEKPQLQPRIRTPQETQWQPKPRIERPNIRPEWQQPRQQLQIERPRPPKMQNWPEYRQPVVRPDVQRQIQTPRVPQYQTPTVNRQPFQVPQYQRRQIEAPRHIEMPQQPRIQMPNRVIVQPQAQPDLQPMQQREEHQRQDLKQHLQNIRDGVNQNRGR